MTKIQKTNKRIKTAVFDIDDTLRPHFKPLVEGLELARDSFAMMFCEKLRESQAYVEKGNSINWLAGGVMTLEQLKEVQSRMARVSAEMIQESIAKVFVKHGTTDYHYLIQEMDIFRWVFGELNPEVFEIMKTEFVEIGKAVIRKVKNEKHHASPFKGILYLLKTLSENGIECYAYSNAPIYQALGRLKHAGLLPYFKMIFGVPDKVEQVLPKLIETKIRLGEFGKDVKWRVVDPKPHGKLDQILEKPVEHIRNHTMVTGDSFSDMLLASENHCLGIHAKWGGVDSFDQKRMGAFSNDEIEAQFRQSGKGLQLQPDAEIIPAETPYVVPKIINLKKAA